MHLLSSLLSFSSFSFFLNRTRGTTLEATKAEENDDREVSNIDSLTCRPRRTSGAVQTLLFLSVLSLSACLLSLLLFLRFCLTVDQILKWHTLRTISTTVEEKFSTTGGEDEWLVLVVLLMMMMDC